MAGPMRAAGAALLSLLIVTVRAVPVSRALLRLDRRRARDASGLPAPGLGVSGRFLAREQPTH